MQEFREASRGYANFIYSLINYNCISFNLNDYLLLIHLRH